MNGPPRRPWTKGRNPEYACFHLAVQVCEDEHGRVWSQHRFETEEDEEIACTLSGGGARQVAHALLLEALRREVWCDILVELTKDGDGYVERYVQGDEDERREIEQELAGAAAKVVAGLFPKLLPGVAREMMEMLLAQLAGTSVDEDPASTEQ